MKPSEILRKAAKKVEEGEWIGGCNAIQDASDSFNGILYATRYFCYVRPVDAGLNDFWWPQKSSYGPRIIGLCLAAAIAESEGD